jgi:hypothetical protein
MTKSTWSGAGTRSASDRAWASLQAHHVWYDMTKSARHDTAQPRPQLKCHHLTLRPHTLTHPRPHSGQFMTSRPPPRCPHCRLPRCASPLLLTLLHHAAGPHRPQLHCRSSPPRLYHDSLPSTTPPLHHPLLLYTNANAMAKICAAAGAMDSVGIESSLPLSSLRVEESLDSERVGLDPETTTRV